MDYDKPSCFDTYIGPDGTRYVRWDGQMAVVKVDPMLTSPGLGELKALAEASRRQQVYGSDSSSDYMREVLRLRLGESRPAFEPPPRPKLDTPETGRFGNLDWGLP